MSVGLAQVIVGVALFTVKVWGLDTLLPGFFTVMGKLPAAVRSPARIFAVNWVELTKVFTLAKPLNCTSELLTKLVPFTVIGKAASPTVLLVGEMLVVMGSAVAVVYVGGVGLGVGVGGGGGAGGGVTAAPIAVTTLMRPND